MCVRAWTGIAERMANLTRTGFPTCTQLLGCGVIPDSDFRGEQDAELEGNGDIPAEQLSLDN